METTNNTAMKITALLNAAVVIVGILLVLVGAGIGIATFFTAQTIVGQNNFVPMGIAMLFFVSAFVALLAIEIVLLICRWVYKNREQL